MSAPLLIATDIVAGYVPDMPIVHGVSAHVSPGEVTTIIGPNGAGKSTFLKALIGLVTIESGTVTLAGADVTRMPSQSE